MWDVLWDVFIWVLLLGIGFGGLSIISIWWEERRAFYKERNKIYPPFYHSIIHSMNNVQKAFFIIGIMSFVYGGFRLIDINFNWTDEIDIVLSFVLMIGGGLGYYLFKDD